LLFGRSVYPFTYLPFTHPLYQVRSDPYPFSPETGQTLLTQLGWQDTDSDGIRDKAGTPLRLTLISSSEALLKPIATQLRDHCGIEIDPRPLTRGELLGDWPEGVVFGRRFELAIFTWHIGNVPPCELWMTAQIASNTNPGGANNTGYSNPAFDTVCRRALTTLDPALAAQHHAEAQRLWAQDLPVLPLFFTARTAAARPEVQGFMLDPTSPSVLWNIESLGRQP
jgi:peptide/nickel transport system substrate-binding protein